MPLTLSAPVKTEPHIKDDTSAFRPESPFKRSILGVIENVLPSSPDLLSVPETPKSQIRLSSSFTTDKNHLSPQACRDVSLICQSPVSREQSARHILTKDDRKTKRDFSGPRKRLISPPQESHNAKRSMNSKTLAAHSLKVASPVKAAQSDVLNKGSEMFSRDYSTREAVLRNSTVKNKTGSKFNLMTEQKAAGAKACDKPTTHLDVSVHAAAALVQKYSLPAATPALATTAEEEGTGCSRKEAVGRAVHSSKGDMDSGTLDPGRVEGIVIQLCVTEPVTSVFSCPT